MSGRELADPWAATRLDLFERIERTLDGDAHDELAVATVVGVDGSAYRRPGAKMVLDDDGSTYGAVTAGCLEGPLQDVARDVLADGSPTVVTFDLTDDDGWGLGLGCEGIVDVLVEPLDPSWREPVDAFGRGEPVTFVTAVDGTDEVPVGSRAIVHADGSTTRPENGPALPAPLLDRVASDARELAADGGAERRSVRTDADTVELFVDGIEPATRLVIFGGQPDVRPVTRLARDVGLDVTVATARGGQADADAFPRAGRVVATHPTDLGDLVDERTYVVIMSHNLLDDRLALESLLETSVPYVGVMGPRERFERLCEQLREDGVELTAADTERIATPVGLDLGGGEPVQIAMSIVAEVLAASNGRTGGRLCDRAGPIHDRPSSVPESDSD